MSWRQPYSGYLFDLDGTLIDTAPDLNRALNHTLSLLQLAPVDEAMTRHWVGHGARVMIEQALAFHNLQPDSVGLGMDRLWQEFLDYYHAHIADFSRPYPGVVETLHQLQRNGAVLAVVTNKHADLSRTLLTELDLLHHFHTLVGGDTCTRPKPHPEPIWHCLEQIGLTAQQVLFVGDSATDVNAAKAADTRVVCMRDGYNHGIDPTTLGADEVIDNFKELLCE
ncbi:MAG: phosphoglycolate phosphatase [Pseudomonadota bacterium]